MAKLKSTEENVIQILEGLGFELEFNTWSDDDYEYKNKFMRFRHVLAPDTRDFALIIYKDYNLELVLEETRQMLLKVGQYQKIQQLKSFIE